MAYPLLSETIHLLQVQPGREAFKAILAITKACPLRFKAQWHTLALAHELGGSEVHNLCTQAMDMDLC